MPKGKADPKIGTITRSWEGGPLRRFSSERIVASWIPLDSGGYAGPYVCDVCQKESKAGVLRRKDGLWCCPGCKNAQFKANRSKNKGKKKGMRRGRKRNE